MVRSAGTHEHFTQGCGFQRRLASTWQSSGNPWCPLVVDLAPPGRHLAPLATLDYHWPVLARPCSRRDSLGRPSQKVDAPTLSGPCEATRSNWVQVRPGASHRASADKALATMDKMKVYKRSRRWKPHILSSFAPQHAP